MAVGILQMQQGGKKEQYEQINEAMFGQSSPRQDQVPEGLIIHTAGPTDDGWYVYDVWGLERHSSASWTKSSGRRSARSLAISRRLLVRSRSSTRSRASSLPADRRPISEPFLDSPACVSDDEPADD